MTTKPITLHEDESSKVVQLSGDYSTGWGTTINELKAAFYQSGLIELHRFKNDDGGEVTHFALSAEEVVALFENWETFKAAQELKKLVEQKRVADVIAEAHTLVAELPIEIIKEPETDEWRIHSESINTIRYHAYHADQLLERTRMAVKDYERHQFEQAIHDEIAAIKRACSAIKVTGRCVPWYVYIDNPDIYGEHATSPEQLLERVKAAQAKYEQWQQEELI